MKLSPKALEAIDNKTVRLKLAIALNLTEQSIIRLIAKNSDTLTKAAALEVIKAETGLTEEEILIPDNVNA